MPSARNTMLLLALPPLAFLAVFYFYPLASIMELSLFPDGMFTTEPLSQLFASSYYARILWFTFWQAGASTLLTLICAVPAAFVFSHYTFKGKQLFLALSGIPFVLPTIVVAAAFSAFLGPKGMLNEMLMHLFFLERAPVQLEHTVEIILLAHVFYNFTVVLRIVGGFWDRLDPSLTEAARMLGASPVQAFRRVTLPLLAPALLTSALLVFIFCFCSFGVILVLGGPRFATLEVAIFQQAVHMFNLPMAAALSLLQIMFTFALMWVYTWLQRKTSHTLGGQGKLYARPCRNMREKTAVWAVTGFMGVLLGLPLLSLIWESVSGKNGFSFAAYTGLFANARQSIFYVPPSEAILNSVAFGAATMGIALVLGLCAAHVLAGSGEKKGTGSRLTAILDPLFMLPLSTSAVTLGFGFIIALDEPPLNLRSSVILVPIAHALVAFPFVVRTMLPAMRAIPHNLREAASVLGASPLRVWLRIDAPILSRVGVAAAVFAFTISLGEFGATVFVAQPQRPTMPLAIYRFLGQPGAANHAQAMAMSSLLMLVTAAGFLTLERFRPRRWGEF